MVICAIGLQLVAMCSEAGGKRLRVQDDLLGIRAETGLGDLKEGGGNGSNGLMNKQMRKIDELSIGKPTLL